MKKTILSHFYNEEYLLPFWLNHHKKYFDHGILINYGSTDSSVEIIKEICPTWEVIDTKCEYFYAPCTDPEIVEIEKNINGWRICLNTTEFLFGNFNLLNYITEKTQFIIREHIMVDNENTQFTEVNNNLFKERQYGIHASQSFDFGYDVGDRGGRSMHNYPIDYPTVVGPGRHFRPPTFEKHTTEFVILWYGYSPFNEKLIARKLQIQTKHHPNGQWTGGHNITRDELLDRFKKYQSISYDLSNEINKLL